jgi:hypothetical protein
MKTKTLYRIKLGRITEHVFLVSASKPDMAIDTAVSIQRDNQPNYDWNRDDLLSIEVAASGIYEAS